MPKKNGPVSVRPKKHLGQHFLNDSSIASNIVEALPLNEGHVIIEIGPGMGILSEFLAEKVMDNPSIRYELIDFDKESVLYLINKENYSYQNINIHHADILKLDWAEYSRKLDLIGNLPYNISSPIFFKILEHLDYVDNGVFMVQKEVADRICALHGNKTYGILSVLMQTFYECEVLFDVNPGSFFPRPKVMSSVFRIKKINNGPNHSLYKVLRSFVKRAFNQRKKC